MNLFAGDVFSKIDQYVLTPLGLIFVNLIKMLEVSIAFFSSTPGTAGLGDPKKIGRIGLKTISYFLITTTLAITIGIGLAYVFQPDSVGEFYLSTAKFEATEAPPVAPSLLPES